MCEIEVPERPEWENGKRLHRIIQDHFSGKKPVETLKHLDFKFPVVEEKDFDPRCKFYFKVNEKYGVVGYLDGFSMADKTMLEIKTGNPMWTVGKFAKSMQRKIYAIGRPELTVMIGVTAYNKDDEWNVFQPKAFILEQTDKDREEAMEWILKGIEIIESGSFKGGLDENGKCVDFNCQYGYNCQFK